MHMSLHFKLVSYRKHVVESCFLDSLWPCLCFNRWILPFTLKEMIDIVGLISTIFPVVFYFFPLFFVPIFFFHYFSAFCDFNWVLHMISFSLLSYCINYTFLKHFLMIALKWHYKFLLCFPLFSISHLFFLFFPITSICTFTNLYIWNVHLKLIQIHFRYNVALFHRQCKYFRVTKFLLSLYHRCHLVHLYINTHIYIKEGETSFF